MDNHVVGGWRERKGFVAGPTAAPRAGWISGGREGGKGVINEVEQRSLLSPTNDLMFYSAV